VTALICALASRMQSPSKTLKENAATWMRKWSLSERASDCSSIATRP
jgi:hypothetical protein